MFGRDPVQVWGKVEIYIVSHIELVTKYNDGAPSVQWECNLKGFPNEEGSRCLDPCLFGETMRLEFEMRDHAVGTTRKESCLS